MSIFVILVLLLFGNWLLSDVLVFIPFDLYRYISSFGWVLLGMSLLLFLGWCLGDE